MLTIYGAFSENQLVGLLYMRGEGHISMFFVKGKFHRHGFGRKLFELALQNSSAEKITVDSSPYAVEVYHRLGFADITPEQTKDGIRFTPMEYKRKIVITYTNSISVEDYNMLRASAGWMTVLPEQAEAGLKGSSLVIAAKDGNKTVGTARLISDGSYTALIKDVLVLPEYQGQGIGTAMMTNILEYLKKNLKPGHSIQIDLMSAKGKESFYEKFGFAVRPRENRGAGMDMWIHGKMRHMGKFKSLMYQWLKTT